MYILVYIPIYIFICNTYVYIFNMRVVYIYIYIDLDISWSLNHDQLDCQSIIWLLNPILNRIITSGLRESINQTHGYQLTAKYLFLRQFFVSYNQITP